jgi:predicted DsbA family dithiol-disulfide isomerase
VGLIGDAAHLALPFTSAGTTNALIDAKVLTEKLVQEKDAERAFTAFYNERIASLKEHLYLGRNLKEKFLSPMLKEGEEINIPLIPNILAEKKTGPKYKKVHLLYFTDPICSTCWTIQPQLRKLKLEYDQYLEVEYCMGGLLPSWENYDRGGIKTPEDAFRYWQIISENQEMPIKPDIWKRNPLQSSFPPSIAFKAAQMQDIDKAIIFLRKINEWLFVENKNILDLKHIRQAAYESGLDAAKIVRDMEHKARTLFELDLKMAEELQISVLPTFIFTDKFNSSKIISGYQTYEQFEETLLEFIPEAQKSLINRKYNKLFKKYPTLTTAEFGFLTDNNNTDAILILKRLNQKGIIEKYGMKNEDIIWKLVN